MKDSGDGTWGGRMPTALRLARLLLLLIIVAGPLGIVSIGGHMRAGWHHEAADARARDAFWLTERILQWIAAAVGLWALSRRHPVGRWIAAGLAVYLAFKTTPEVVRAVRVMLGQPDPHAGLLQYRSAGEGFGGALVQLGIVAGLTLLGARLALGGRVREYFQPRAAREDARST